MKYHPLVFRVEECNINIFMLSVIHNPYKNAKWLSILMKKIYFFSHTTIMATTKRKISVRNKEYTTNKFKYEREERIQISSAKEIGHRVVGGVAVGAGGVISPAYGVAVGLELRAVAGKTGAAVYRLGVLEGEWRRTHYWVPETSRSPLSSGLVGGVWLRGKRPPPARHQRCGRHFLLAGLLGYGDMRPGG